MSNKHWYIIYSAGGPHAVINVQDAFCRADTKTDLWIPMMREKVTEDGVVVVKNNKMFFNYIFVCCDISNSNIDTQLADLKVGWFLKAPGEERPCIIDEIKIAEIKAQEVLLSETEQESIPLSVGDYVEIRGGAFIDFKGQVMAINNKEVSIETFVFGRTNTVKVSIDTISKMSLSEMYPVVEEENGEIKEIDKNIKPKEEREN
jgi:transcription antitermination factor NusG